MEAWAIEAHWLWLGAGVLLLVGEALLPGTVLLWFGIAAIITGSVTFLLAPAWDTQVLIFSVLGVASTAVFWYWRKHNPQPESQGPKVNQAGADLIGTVLTLSTAIEDGRGRAKLGDSSWRVDGPDLPAGAKIRVVAVDGGTLRVEAAQGSSD